MREWQGHGNTLGFWEKIVEAGVEATRNEQSLRLPRESAKHEHDRVLTVINISVRSKIGLRSWFEVVVDFNVDKGRFVNRSPMRKGNEFERKIC